MSENTGAVMMCISAVMQMPPGLGAYGKEGCRAGACKVPAGRLPDTNIYSRDVSSSMKRPIGF